MFLFFKCFYVFIFYVFIFFLYIFLFPLLVGVVLLLVVIYCFRKIHLYTVCSSLICDRVFTQCALILCSIACMCIWSTCFVSHHQFILFTFGSFVSGCNVLLLNNIYYHINDCQVSALMVCMLWKFGKLNWNCFVKAYLSLRFLTFIYFSTVKVSEVAIIMATYN